MVNKFHSKVKIHHPKSHDIYQTAKKIGSLTFSTKIEGVKSKSGNYHLRINLEYVNLPVLLQYIVGKGFRLEGGPKIGIFMNSKVESNLFQFGIFYEY